MSKWEFAAIVKYRQKMIKLNKDNIGYFDRWFLVKPGNEPHTIVTKEGSRRFSNPEYPWRSPPEWEEVKIRCEKQGNKVNDSSPIILFEATDPLVLVNLAGAEGWEITGGLGLADGQHGSPESKWRIMRREL